MRSEAAEPADADRPVGPTDGRASESASFATIRVRSGPGQWPPIFIVGFILLLGAVVMIGVGGKPGPTVAPPVAGVAANTTAPVSARPTVTFGSDQSPGGLPVVTSEPGPVQFEARRSADKVFVHGDLFVPRVTWVFVSLVDDAGRVASWSSVSLPGAAGPAQSDGPTMRFDVELTMPAYVAGRLWLSAIVYDAAGTLVASIRLQVPSP